MEEQKNKRGPKPKNKPEPERTAQKGTKEGEERFSFIAKTQHIEDMKNIAYWQRTKHYKTVIDSAFADFIEAWKVSNKEHVADDGTIIPRPEGE